MFKKWGCSLMSSITFKKGKLFNKRPSTNIYLSVCCCVLYWTDFNILLKILQPCVGVRKREYIRIIIIQPLIYSVDTSILISIHNWMVIYLKSYNSRHGLGTTKPDRKKKCIITILLTQLLGKSLCIKKGKSGKQVMTLYIFCHPG